MLDGMPNHEELMKGVHGLLGDGIGDHSNHIMSSIDKLPLPPDEKVLLQAIENMQEASLGQTLEAVEKVEKQLAGHGEGVAGAFDEHGKRMDSIIDTLDGIPDHKAIMQGVHGLLSESIGEHGGKIMGEINKLPIPADEKVMLQAIENMQESVLTTVLEAIEKLNPKAFNELENVYGTVLETMLEAIGKIQMNVHVEGANT